MAAELPTKRLNLFPLLVLIYDGGDIVLLTIARRLRRPLDQGHKAGLQRGGTKEEEKKIEHSTFFLLESVKLRNFTYIPGNEVNFFATKSYSCFSSNEVAERCHSVHDRFKLSKLRLFRPLMSLKVTV